MYLLKDVFCGNLGGGIDSQIPGLTHTVYTIIKIAIPIIIVFLGMLDLAKAVVANDEKDMKAAQGKLIKRIVYGILVFFVLSLVQLIFSSIDKDNMGTNSCFNCFLNNKCSSTAGTVEPGE